MSEFAWSVSGAEGLDPDATPTLSGGRRPAPQPGEAVGPYTVVEELGRGGMGVVLRARDREAGRDVALKVVLHELDDDARARFQREGEITAALRHPGIVRVHAGGEHEGRPYLACELVEDARPLDHDWGRLPLEARVERVLAAARALGFAHAQGIVHRDVKAENALVDRAGHVRVSDFGLAAARNQERLTQTGALVGTPLTMAPEQFQSNQAPIGPAADVWSLGVLLYVALTGTYPFDGRSLLELGAQITQSDPPRPRAVAPGVPAPLETVCLRALAKEPALRHADGAAFAEALERALAGEGERRPLVTAGRVVGLALLALFAALIAATRPDRVPERLRREAAARRADVLAQNARSMLDLPFGLAGQRANVASLVSQVRALGPAGEGARPTVEAVLGLAELAAGDAEAARRIAAGLPPLPLRDLLRAALRTEGALQPAEALEVLRVLRTERRGFHEFQEWFARAVAACPSSGTGERAQALELLRSGGGRWLRRPDRIALARLELAAGEPAKARAALEPVTDPPRDLLLALTWRELPALSPQAALKLLDARGVSAAEVGGWPERKRRAQRERLLAGTAEELAQLRREARPARLAARLARLRLARRLVDDPLPPELLEWLLDLYRLRAEDDVGLAFAISDLAPDDYTAHRKLVERLEGVLKAEVLEQVEPIVARALKLAPSQAERDRIQACHTVMLNEQRQAKRCIRVASQILPRLDEPELRGKVLRARGEAFQDRGAHEASLADFEAALPLQPREHKSISLLKARALQALKRPGVGRAALAYALSGRRSAKHFEAVCMVWKHDRAAHPDDARRAVEKLLRYDPYRGGWWLRAAWLRLRCERDGVEAALNAAATWLPKSKHAEARALAPRVRRLAERARVEAGEALRGELQALVDALERLRRNALTP